MLRTGCESKAHEDRCCRRPRAGRIALSLAVRRTLPPQNPAAARAARRADPIRRQPAGVGPGRLILQRDSVPKTLGSFGEQPAGPTHPVKFAACGDAEEDSSADAIGICLSVGQAQRHAPGPPEQRPLFDWSVGADLGSSRSRSMSASKSDVVPLKGQEGVASVRRAASAATLIEEDETVAFGVEIASPAGHSTGARPP